MVILTVFVSSGLVVCDKFTADLANSYLHFTQISCVLSHTHWGFNSVHSRTFPFHRFLSHCLLSSICYSTLMNCYGKSHWLGEMPIGSINLVKESWLALIMLTLGDHLLPGDAWMTSKYVHVHRLIMFPWLSCLKNMPMLHFEELSTVFC